MTKINQKFQDLKKKKIPFRTTQVIAVGFLLIILTGACLLTLPIATKAGTATSFIDALFTATTATCVTGLVVFDTYSHWNVFGQLIILALIQIGGLGFMTVGTLFSLALRRRVSFRQRMLMSESLALDTSSTSGVVRITRHVLLGTLMFEGLGAAILAVRFIPDYGFAQGLYMGIFHSISAFCNAGIDVMGIYQPFSSLTSYAQDWIVNITICALIIIGGTGFFVWEDVYHARHWRDLSMHSKLVISMNIVLVLSGTLIVFCMDFNNPGTLGPMPISSKFLASLFMSTTSRTAGFNTVDLAQLSVTSTFIVMVLMFIGGAPGSTAGGVKTTTIGLLVFTVFAAVRGTTDVNAYGRRIDEQSIRRAITIVMISLAVVVFGIIVLSASDPHLDFDEIVFEVISAFGTVGLTLGITPTLSTISKLALIIIMYFGRVGIFTIMMSLTVKGLSQNTSIRLPRGKILI